jgi:hypothetical protein
MGVPRLLAGCSHHFGLVVGRETHSIDVWKSPFLHNLRRFAYSPARGGTASSCYGRLGIRAIEKGDLPVIQQFAA